MIIKEKCSDGEMTLLLEGNFDDSTCFSVEKKVGEIFDKEFKTLNFDLEKVRYISSAGIRVLILSYKWAMKKGRKVSLANMSPKVKEIMDSVGILPMFSNR